VIRFLPGGRERAWHEAYHAAALCIAGLVPTCVRTDFPNEHEAGAVTINWGEGGYRDPAKAKAVLVSIVLGGLTEGRAGWEWDNWPIDPCQMAEGAVGDGLMARELIEHFEMDRVDWAHVLWRADQLGRRRDFRRLVVRIADELERVELLYADDLRALMEPESEREALAA
jgi:hypothetical protein